MPRTNSAQPQAPPEQSRPDLTADLAPEEFLAWYWLKGELLLLCRSSGLRTAGSKPELESRIEAFLSGRPLPKLTSRTPSATRMPATFYPGLRIEPGWRCNPLLGAYFRTILGNGFRFNKAMRDFIHTQHGKTLLEAEQCYLASICTGSARPPILPQLEYNQHFRDFYAVPRCQQKRSYQSLVEDTPLPQSSPGPMKNHMPRSPDGMLEIDHMPNPHRSHD